MKDYRKYFIKGARKSFPGHFTAIINETNENFKTIAADTRFAATSPNPIDRRLDFAAYFLAFLKTLDRYGESFESIRKISLEIVLDYVRPKNRFEAIMKRLPAWVIPSRLGSFFLEKFKERVNKNPNANGFIATIITDKNETFGLGYGVDILECGICKLFNKHNYQKYSSLLCEVDAVTADLAGLKMIRTGTIALGAKKCDFRWKKKDQF
jgi:hypothetical protein